MVVWEITTVSDAQLELENVTMIGCVHEQQKTTKTNTETRKNQTETKQYKAKERSAFLAGRRHLCSSKQPRTPNSY